MGFFDFIFGSSETVDLTEEIASGAVLIDVRTPEEYKAGSVQGAKNVPLQLLSSKLSSLNKNTHYIVFCRSGNRSGMAKTMMEKAGFAHVINGGSVGQVKNFIK